MALPDHAIQADEGGHTFIRGAVHEDRLALMRVHCVEEGEQVSLGWSRKLNRNVDVFHPRRAHTSGFILPRVAWVVVQREVDNDLYALGCRIGQLLLVWLASGQQARVNLAEVIGL